MPVVMTREETTEAIHVYGRTSASRKVLLRNTIGSFARTYFWPMAIGAVAIGLLLMVPILEWPLRFFLLFVGLGAMSRTLWHSVMKRE